MLGLSPGGWHCSPQDEELVKKPIPGTQRLIGVFGGFSAHERGQGRSVWQLLDTWISFWREMGWVRVGFRNTEPVIVLVAKEQKALVSPKTSAQVLVIPSSPLEQGLQTVVFSVQEEGSPRCSEGSHSPWRC